MASSQPPKWGWVGTSWAWLRKRRLENYAFVAVLASGFLFSSSLFDSRELEADGLGALGRIAGTTGLILAFRMVIFFGIAYLVAAVVFLVRSGRWPSEISTKGIRFAEKAEDKFEGARNELERISEENDRLKGLLEDAGDRIKELENRNAHR